MKILFNTYPWAFHCPGGGEIQIGCYRDALSDRGIEVLPFDPWNPQFDAADVVHFFSVMGGSVHFCQFVKSLGLPLVISSSLWVTEATRNLYPLGEIRAQLALADAIVPNSITEADALARILDLPRERFMPVYNGVDPIFCAPIDPSLFREHFGITGPFLLNVGNIEPRKNQLALVQAIRGLDLDLILIGRARDPHYHARVLEEGGPQVRYLGPFGHQDPLLRSAYAACAAFVLPSTLETPGLAALEAAAAGAPLVITAEGSTREYFGDLARYVDPGSPEDIRQKIEEILAQGPAPDLQSRTGSRFIWPRVVDDLIAIYEKVADFPPQQ